MMYTPSQGYAYRHVSGCSPPGPLIHACLLYSTFCIRIHKNLDFLAIFSLKILSLIDALFNKCRPLALIGGCTVGPLYHYDNNNDIYLTQSHISTVFVPIPTHAPITAHQRHFQIKICGTINRPLKSSHPVASHYVPSPVLNTENHQLTLC